MAKPNFGCGPWHMSHFSTSGVFHPLIQILFQPLLPPCSLIPPRDPWANKVAAPPQPSPTASCPKARALGLLQMDGLSQPHLPAHRYYLSHSGCAGFCWQLAQISYCNKQCLTVRKKRPVANPRGSAKQDKKEGFLLIPQLQSISVSSSQTYWQNTCLNFF